MLKLSNVPNPPSRTAPAFGGILQVAEQREAVVPGLVVGARHPLWSGKNTCGGDNEGGSAAAQ